MKQLFFIGLMSFILVGCGQDKPAQTTESTTSEAPKEVATHIEPKKDYSNVVVPFTKDGFPKTYKAWGEKWIEEINIMMPQAINLVAQNPKCDEPIDVGLSVERSKPKENAVFYIDCKNKERFYIEQSQLNDSTSTIQTKEASQQTDNQSREKAKKYFLGDNEPTVKDATWASDYVFKVGVVDDGTKRDGFAQYVCETLRSDFNIKDKQLMVEVIDIQKLVSTNKWVELGKATCK